MSDELRGKRTIMRIKLIILYIVFTRRLQPMAADVVSHLFILRITSVFAHRLSSPVGSGEGACKHSPTISTIPSSAHSRHINPQATPPTRSIAFSRSFSQDVCVLDYSHGQVSSS